MVKLYVALFALALTALAHRPVQPSSSEHIDDLTIVAERLLRKLPDVAEVETRKPRFPPVGRLVHVVTSEPVEQIEAVRVLTLMHGLTRVYTLGTRPQVHRYEHGEALDVLPISTCSLHGETFVLVVSESPSLPIPLCQGASAWEYVRVLTNKSAQVHRAGVPSIR